MTATCARTLAWLMLASSVARADEVAPAESSVDWFASTGLAAGWIVALAIAGISTVLFVVVTRD